jgi:hypothetical protein
LYRSGTNRGIDRIATRAQDIDCGKRSLRMRSGSHAIHADRFRTAAQLEITISRHQ